MRGWRRNLNLCSGFGDKKFFAELSAAADALAVVV